MDSLKELVNEANFDVSSTGISLQAMDSSHVCLCYLFLRAEGFDQFRADRQLALGLNLQSLVKVFKCAGSDDSVTFKAEDQPSSIAFMFESKNQERVSHFSLKLLELETEHLGIPDTQYTCVAQLPSSEFRRIVSDIGMFGDTITVRMCACV